MDISKVEPDDGDFESPREGNKICCRISGTHYSATVIHVYSQKKSTSPPNRYYIMQLHGITQLNH